MGGQELRILPRRGWPHHRGFWGRNVGAAKAGMGLGTLPAPCPHTARQGAADYSAAPFLRQHLWCLPRALKTQSGPRAERAPEHGTSSKMPPSSDAALKALLRRSLSFTLKGLKGAEGGPCSTPLWKYSQA